MGHTFPKSPSGCECVFLTLKKNCLFNSLLRLLFFISPLQVSTRLMNPNNVSNIQTHLIQSHSFLLYRLLCNNNPKRLQGLPWLNQPSVKSRGVYRSRQFLGEPTEESGWTESKFYLLFLKIVFHLITADFILENIRLLLHLLKAAWCDCTWMN